MEITSDADVAALSSLLVDPGRNRPTIVVTTASGARPRVDVDELAVTIGGRARIAVVPPGKHSTRLSDALRDRGLPTVFGGSARVYAPRRSATKDDDAAHPRIALYEGGESAAVSQLLDVLREVEKRDVVVQQVAESPVPKPGPNPSRLVQKPQEPISSHSASDQIRPPEPRVEVIRVEVPCPEVVSAIAQLSRSLADATDLMSWLRQQLADAEKQLREEAAVCNDLRRDNDRLREQASRNRSKGGGGAEPTSERPVVYADPERQIRHEITQTWLETVSESDRERWPLRDYVLGEDFLASVGTVNASRRKVVEVAVQVITRRAREITAREVRRFTMRSGGDDRRRTRADNAEAWRANIAANTPQAARFLWWELPDGTLELGKAALHDDTDLR